MLRPTNNTAEVSAFFHALQWINLSSSNSALRKDYNILTDSVYCVRLFADNSIKGRCNKALIAKVRRVLSQQVKLRHNLSIGWTRAHTSLRTPEALGNAAADRLVARGRTGSTSAAVMGSVL